MNRKTKKKAKIKLVEIARSFSYKLNVGNYESRDFFCSQKAECAPKDAEKISEALHDFCKAQVIRDVNKFLAEKDAPRAEKPKDISKKEYDFYEKHGRDKSEKKDLFQAAKEEAAMDIVDPYDSPPTELG